MAFFDRFKTKNEDIIKDPKRSDENRSQAWIRLQKTPKFGNTQIKNFEKIYRSTQKVANNVKAKAVTTKEIERTIPITAEARNVLRQAKQDVESLTDKTNATFKEKLLRTITELENELGNQDGETVKAIKAANGNKEQIDAAIQTLTNFVTVKIPSTLKRNSISKAKTTNQMIRNLQKYKFNMTPTQNYMQFTPNNASTLERIQTVKEDTLNADHKAMLALRNKYLVEKKDGDMLPEQPKSNKGLPLVEIDNCNVITNLLDMNPNTVYLYKMNPEERKKALKDKTIAKLIEDETKRLNDAIAKASPANKPKLQIEREQLNELILACYVNSRDNQYNYKPLLRAQLNDASLWWKNIRNHNPNITTSVQGVLLDKIQRQVQGSTTNQKSLSNKVVNKMQFINDKNKAELVNIYAINDDYAIDFLEKNPTKGIIRLKMLKTENMNWYPVLSKKDGDNVIDIKLDDLIKDNRGQELLFRKPIPNMQTLKTTHGLDGITFQWETVLKAVEPKLYNDYLKRKGRYNKNQVEERVSPINKLFSQEEAEAKHADDNPRSMTTSTPKPNKNSEAVSASLDHQEVKVNLKNSTESSGVGTGLNLTGGKRHHSSRNKTVKKNKRQPRRNRTHRK